MAKIAEAITKSTVTVVCYQEAAGVVDPKSWPTLYDTDDLPKKKLQNIHRFPTAEMVCYLDFSVSTTGMLAGIKVSSLELDVCTRLAIISGPPKFFVYNFHCKQQNCKKFQLEVY